MRSKSHVLVVGARRCAVTSAAEAAAELVGCPVRHADDAVAAAKRIRAERPAAVLIAASEEGCVQVSQLKAGLRQQLVPMVGIHHQPTEIVFEEAFSAGFDDVSGSSARALAARLRPLVDVGPQDVAADGHYALVVDPDPASRLRVGRVFRQAGYRVGFAADAETAWTMATQHDVRVAVVSAEIEPAEPVPLVVRAAEAGSPAAWIVHTPPPRISEMRGALELPVGAKVAIHDSFASPETLLFVANELLNRPSVDARSSERLLYGTVVQFRRAGRSEAEHGYLYNLSAGGVFVRTLAPPARGEELWLELTPPRHDRLVHLEGTCVWARSFGPGTNATVPFGFGVQLTGGSEADMARYLAGYERLHGEQAGEVQRPWLDTAA